MRDEYKRKALTLKLYLDKKAMRIWFLIGNQEGIINMSTKNRMEGAPDSLQVAIVTMLLLFVFQFVFALQTWRRPLGALYQAGYQS